MRDIEPSDDSTNTQDPKQPGACVSGRLHCRRHQRPRRAGEIRRGSQSRDGGSHRAAGSTRTQQTAHSLPGPSIHDPADQRHRRGCQERRFHRERDPNGPPPTVDSRHGPGDQARRAGREEHSQRRVRVALWRRRVDVRRRRRARPGLDDVARQSAEPEAGHPPRPRVSGGRRTGRRRNESVGARLLRPADDRRLVATARLHDEVVSPAGAAPRRPSRRTCRRFRFLSFHRRRDALHRPQPSTAADVRRVPGALPAEDPDGRRSGALERHPFSSRAAPRASGRSDQGVRARRTDRGVLPVDGDPRRPRRALRWLQHGSLGLHQQRLGCDGLGPGVRQPEHRRHHDDVRLHAELRGPRAPGGQYPRPAGTDVPSGRVAWSRTFRSGRRLASRAA